MDDFPYEIYGWGSWSLIFYSKEKEKKKGGVGVN